MKSKIIRRILSCVSSHNIGQPTYIRIWELPPYAMDNDSLARHFSSGALPLQTANSSGVLRPRRQIPSGTLRPGHGGGEGQKMDRLEEIIGLFPDYLRDGFGRALQSLEELQEIRMRVNRPVLFVSGRREFCMTADGAAAAAGDKINAAAAVCMTSAKLGDIINHICQYSLYAFADELRQGYLTVQGGHRVGVAGQVVLNEQGGIRSIKHISYVNIRISHEIKGAADSLLPFLYEKGEFLNVMIVSPPGCGKTTLLRDLIRQVSDGGRFGQGRTVGVVDERSEIAGSYQGVAQNDVGLRTDVMDACPKALGMLLLLRSMAPQIIAVDELGEREDVQALGQAALSGIGLMVTIHGDGIEDIKHRIYLQELLKRRCFKRFVVLGKENGMCRIKGIYDGAYEKCLNG